LPGVPTFLARIWRRRSGIGAGSGRWHARLETFLARKAANPDQGDRTPSVTAISATPAITGRA
jgi:hypothetical protein